jgi:mannose-6-phosphate isomerase class I
MTPFRKTSQHLAPSRVQPTPPGVYDIYPAYPLPPGRIDLGFPALAQRILGAGHRTVVIEGFVGVLWDTFVPRLDAELRRLGATAAWHPVAGALRDESAIEALIAPFLGGDDPLFGTRCPLPASDFFSAASLQALPGESPESIRVIYGPGASLACTDALLIYVDVPKNEVQFRSRTGAITNFASRRPLPPKPMYKRMYFVDWPVLLRLRESLLPRIDIMVDEQRPDEPTLIGGTDLRAGLDAMARTIIRCRPWFEPGPWGGQWIKAHVPQLAQDAPNYAWSFELISPENGIAFESGGTMLEVSFDFLMMHNHRDVLGTFAGRFGYEFPIRYDFLDTFDGGNLSLQCHPRPDYVHRHFGECFTQDEAYYILDCSPGARVYLGFRDGVDPAAFRDQLEAGFRDALPVEVERHVQTHAAHRHDLFLIPHGTIHCSGVNNLVLEISATPYIFTFKMYDWQRLDLDGTPRPLNIARAFDNLNFDRQGETARRELISRPEVDRTGPDWRAVHLPTHERHFYDVIRYEFATTVEIATGGSCQVMNLVAGEWITVETADGARWRFNYAETFIVPAAAGSVRLINEGKSPVMVVATFLKPDARPFAPPPGAETQP